ncbi:MAG TPA: hypothetical protein VKA40_02305 [Nitrososphaera sp.]|nr:hypothetical protein [Nitrososphaera sp.]
MIVAGVAIVFLISGFQVKDVLFAPNITEETQVIIKDEQGTCTVQAADDVPRTISDCPYDVGDTLSLVYKREQPPISEHHLVKEGEGQRYGTLWY